MSLVKVAEVAGVSKATVSRVLNQQGNVHPDTVRRVRNALDTVGYRQNFPRAGRRSKLMTQPTVSLSAFALVVPDVSGGLYLSLQEAFDAASSKEYHQIIVCNTQDDPYKQADQILQLMQKRVAAVAIVTVTSAPTPPHQIHMLQKAGIPVVLLHRGVRNVRAPQIILPLDQIGYAAGRAILERGHRRIAMFPVVDSESGRLHLAGFQRALGEAGVELFAAMNPPGISFATITPEVRKVVSESLERIWRLPPEQRPTALFATFDPIAELVYVTLLAMGVRIPQDVSLVSFGGSSRTGAVASGLSAVVVDEAEAGRRAVALIGEMRSRNRAIESDHQEVMEIEFAPGETLGTPPS